ncbi:methyltransferase type 11 [Natronococcus pandeyae]|uniref:Methyltransferase type 11 n=1 Tax=Natronococcus pandeyae TaxID=2055836 RepID=A0A8J8PZP7_9EURY|nr:class I SAM-dependent methyltransferase [Natronococcus pandeyae]TYL36736.1 methyltransferase type 11 [Natronococcus pandeyae]
MSTDEIRSVYAEKADWIHRMDWFDHRFTGRYRRQLFAAANGRVLDVACGTGPNFRYLPETVDLTGVDISPEMLAKARQRLEGLDLDGTLSEMDAQALEFPDDSFETVVSSLSTCTFPDPIEALEEMSRVCRPDGQILLLEHGRSDVEPIARLQDWRAESHYEKMGCRLNQEPTALVAEAGLSTHRTSSRLLGIITMIQARPASHDPE